MIIREMRRYKENEKVAYIEEINVSHFPDIPYLNMFSLILKLLFTFFLTKMTITHESGCIYFHDQCNHVRFVEYKLF